VRGESEAVKKYEKKSRDGRGGGDGGRGGGGETAGKQSEGGHACMNALHPRYMHTTRASRPLGATRNITSYRPALFVL
jgi:hypothetical protein